MTADDHDLLAQLRQQTQRLKAEADGTGQESRNELVRHTLEQLIPGGLFTVVADSQHPGLRGVPWDNLMDPHKVVLNFSKNFRAKDLRVEGGCLNQCLSFGGKLCAVEVPLGAIYRILRQNGNDLQVWAFREEPHDDGDGNNEPGKAS